MARRLLGQLWCPLAGNCIRGWGWGWFWAKLGKTRGCGRAEPSPSLLVQAALVRAGLRGAGKAGLC